VKFNQYRQLTEQCRRVVDRRPEDKMCINQLLSPGARVELDMIMAIPRKV
jgi:hypothetical protein